jgi:hypothetical protein
VLTKILDDASGAHRPVRGPAAPQLESGRLHFVHGDTGRDGHLLVNLREFDGVPFRSLDELERGTLDAGGRRDLQPGRAQRCPRAPVGSRP